MLSKLIMVACNTSIVTSAGIVLTDTGGIKTHMHVTSQQTKQMLLQVVPSHPNR